MLLTITLLVLIGGLSAIIGSIVGIGGGIIIVPTMVYLGVEHGLLHNITNTSSDRDVFSHSNCDRTFFITWISKNKTS